LNSKAINFANLVCLARVALAFITIALLLHQHLGSTRLAFVLTIFVIWADQLDGYLARKLNQVTKLGGILDIACDRIVEIAYWVTFAVLGWISIWIPFLFIVRGTLVDAVRAYYQEKGFTAFGAKTMMQSSIGKFLVTSNFSRFSYAVAKAIAFCLMILIHTNLHYSWLNALAHFFVYFACVLCVIRGLPVLLETGDLLFVKRG
jgi:CDP-diacylglycerol--glycerol-3-phosphate 3-phosphatidyltransferase